jgi:hypothetical protein
MNDMIDETVKLLRTLGHEVDEEAVAAIKGYANELLPSPPMCSCGRCEAPLIATAWVREKIEYHCPQCNTFMVFTPGRIDQEFIEAKTISGEVTLYPVQRADYNHEQEELGK